MKNINIHKEANIRAAGNRTSRHTKAVLCIETGEVWTSGADAAESIGVHFTAMSAVCTGKLKSLHGKHYCYLNEALENLNAVMTRLREANEMEADAKKWREQEAAKEVARKAEERRLEEERKARERYEAAVAKAEAKVTKFAADCAKHQARFNESMAALEAANKELEALLDRGVDNNA